MIKIEHTDVYGFESAIRGMRNPMNSWDKMDSHWELAEGEVDWDGKLTYHIGENDLKLMKSLAKAGSDHGKFLRFIDVTVDITAPLFWWKEFDTYKVGTVANSCSTMHKIQAKEFEMSDFSFEHLTEGSLEQVAKPIVHVLNGARDAFLNYEKYNAEAPDGWDKGINCQKDVWWQMIELLPSAYNQKRTIKMNYQVLKSMYFARRNHKLDDWHTFCEWCESLPYFREVVIQDDCD